VSPDDSPSFARVEPPNIRLDLSWPAPSRRRRRWPARVAASAALAACLGAGFVAGRLTLPPPAADAPIVAGPSGAMMAAGPLSLALDRQLASAQRPTDPVAIGLSFLADDDAMCRTFVMRRGSEIAGLACRARGGGWRIRMAVSRNVPGDDTPAPVLEAVDQIIHGSPLDAAGERAARDAGWAPR